LVRKLLLIGEYFVWEKGAWCWGNCRG
jgi:hypothetical protein